MSLVGTKLVIHHLATDKYKVKIWGQSADHVMDWNGCNFRIATIAGQPLRGFATKEEAETWARNKFKDQQDVDDYAYALDGIGTFLKDKIFSRLHDVDF